MMHDAKMFGRFFAGVFAYFVFCVIVSFGVLGFIIWVVIKVMQHFRVI